jgi:hypothetical protein
MTVGWLRQAVDEFWQSVGEDQAFPRDLEEAMFWTSLPLNLKKMPQLCVSEVDKWLEKYNMPFQLLCPNRPLYGCLIAYAGHGYVLLDEADSEEQNRFSLAHEIAHFLLDYIQPRQSAIAQLGEPITEVLDGLRPQSLDERVHALLCGVTLGVHVDLMERRSDGSHRHSCVVEIEDRADRLALELLAPEEMVRRYFLSYERPQAFQGDSDRLVQILIQSFGLPLEIAQEYGRFLYQRWYGGQSVREWLKL